MAYSQAELVRLMGEGALPGETVVPKRIETVISNVFIFPQTVYKLYKNDNPFFNGNFRDLSSKEIRFDFTRKDFAWNTALSPSIYRELRGVLVRDGAVEFVSAESGEAEELVFVMERVRSEDVLFEKLLRGEISEEDGRRMGSQLAESLARVRHSQLTGDYFEIFGKSIQDVREWVAGVPEHISAEERERYCDFLEQFRQEHREWYEKELSGELASSGDMHSHNAIYAEGTLFLMDTYPPKEEWIVAHELLPFYRLGADLRALAGEEVYEAYRRSYEEATGKQIDRKLDAPYILYAASIMAAYLYMLHKNDPAHAAAAERYHQFLRAHYEKALGQ